jgi:uncharacterized protein (DUF885 family)
MRKLFTICVLMFAPYAAAAGGTADQQARALFDMDWQWRLQNRPEFATSIGDYRFDATLSDTTLAASRAATRHQRQMLEQARLIERDQLAAPNQLSYDLFVYQKERDLKAASFYLYIVQPITAQDGIHISFGQMVAQMPFATETDYRNYLARLDALPRHIDGLIEQMREATRSGWVAPKVTVRPLPAMLRQLRENLVGGALGAPFRQIPATIPKPVRDQLAAAGPAALRMKAAPALQKLEDYLRSEYLPLARDSIAAGSLPAGPDYYAFAVRDNTSAELTAADIHALGIREVARIQAAMRAAIARTGFTGSFDQFIAFATTDPRLFYSKPELLLKRYRSVIARASAGLPQLFATVPGEEIGVKSLSEAGAEKQGAAYYEAGAADRPAAIVVNTSRLDTRPIWEIETLALHEAVPGHHLQVARAHDIADLPDFRRYGWYAAFGEGWALYAESLGPELGLFKDPFSTFGHLNGELLRAARLVVDTGIHSLGWSRQQALDYLNANTANPPSDNEIEVDRYIAAPGQALGYKIGQLKIKALRQKAQAALGDKFDLRQFHNAVIDNGPLPLAILEQQVDRWIAAAGRRSDQPASAE